MTAQKRNIENKVNELLGFFPVVIILGVRQCGKTTLAKMLRPNWRYFDLERSKDFDFLTRDFDFFIKEHPHSIIIDEAQRYPVLFQELRGVVDRDRKHKNRFLLTGSSSLDLIKNVSESLAGRVGLVELGTFKANEIYTLDLPDLYNIFSENLNKTTIDFLKGLEPEISHDQLMQTFLKGGYPEPVLEKNDRFYDVWMESYLQTYIQRDIRTLFSRLDLVKYQRFVSMLSALSGTIINRSQVGRSLDISEKAIRDYLEIAEGSYIWRNTPSYEKNAGKSVVKMPKGNIRDSGLANFIQGITKREQLLNYPNVGATFEAFISEEIIKGIQASDIVNWNHYYFRTRNGAEIDMILEGPFGTLPIEIKFGSMIKQRQIQTLKNFIYKNNLPLGIVINNSDNVELISDRIIQLPATCV
ncbi:MAG: ATP-binding protein [Deltaproteobacteria bacterium]|nr:ATP-binding protein [Deltaproteobacteria bacterium]MBW1861930.1 ATP-binding protein [Deltaproteobacteria bacterium]